MDTLRKKLLEAIIFFSKEVRNPTKMMMYKLLAELDFRHFEEKGYPVTDLEYVAWKMGPVPAKLDRELSHNKDVVIPDDFTDSLACEKYEFEKRDGSTAHGFKFRAKRKPDLSVFSPREQRILIEVAEIYRHATATEASKASHEKDKPWIKTPEGHVIDLVETIKLKAPISKEEAREMMRERAAFHRTYHSA
jgi:uncharacterized phage-associated protein